jgi:hypothetical protein
MALTTRSGWRVLANEPLDSAFIAEEFAPIADRPFRHFTRNFAELYLARFPDVFEDWSIVLANARRFAAEARRAGLTGIVFDNEQYGVKVWEYPGDVRHPELPLSDYWTQATRRGRDLMQALEAGFPGLTIIVLNGPHATCPAAPSEVQGGQSGWPAAALQGAFTLGMFEGASDRSEIVDGGEVYAYRSPAEFERSYEYRKREMAQDQRACPFFPDSLKPDWSRRVSIGFGVFNQAYPHGRGLTMNPDVMRQTLANALRRSDRYVWLFTLDMSWFVEGGIDEAWVGAVRGARGARGE